MTVTFPGAAGTALPVGRPSLPTIMPAPLAARLPGSGAAVGPLAARWPLDEDSDDLALTAAK